MTSLEAEESDGSIGEVANYEGTFEDAVSDTTENRCRLMNGYPGGQGRDCVRLRNMDARVRRLRLKKRLCGAAQWSIFMEKIGE